MTWTPPPDYSEFSANAWTRMRDKLIGMGVWRPFDVLLLDVASRQVGLYALMASKGLPPADCEPIRSTARELMGAMLWIEPERAHLGALNLKGYDVEILELAAPLGGSPT